MCKALKRAEQKVKERVAALEVCERDAAAADCTLQDAVSEHHRFVDAVQRPQQSTPASELMELKLSVQLADSGSPWTESDPVLADFPSALVHSARSRPSESALFRNVGSVLKADTVVARAQMVKIMKSLNEQGTLESTAHGMSELRNVKLVALRTAIEGEVGVYRIHNDRFSKIREARSAERSLSRCACRPGPRTGCTCADSLGEHSFRQRDGPDTGGVRCARWLPLTAGDAWD